MEHTLTPSTEQKLKNLGQFVLKFLQWPIWLICIAIILCFAAFGTPGVFRDIFHSQYNPNHFSHLIFFIIYSFFILFIIPLILTRVLYRKSYRDVGLRLPEKPWLALALTLGAMILLIPCIHTLAGYDSFKAYYRVQLNHQELFWLQAAIFPLYYLAEEFFFRGFLFLLLWEKLRVHSFWIMDILFCLIHLTKPGLEVLFAIPVGFILASLTLKTRSILPAVIVHYSLGLALLMTISHVW